VQQLAIWLAVTPRQTSTPVTSPPAASNEQQSGNRIREALSSSQGVAGTTGLPYRAKPACQPTYRGPPTGGRLLGSQLPGSL